MLNEDTWSKKRTRPGNVYPSGIFYNPYVTLSPLTTWNEVCKDDTESLHTLIYRASPPSLWTPVPSRNGSWNTNAFYPSLSRTSALQRIRWFLSKIERGGLEKLIYLMDWKITSSTWSTTKLSKPCTWQLSRNWGGTGLTSVGIFPLRPRIRIDPWLDSPKDT